MTQPLVADPTPLATVVRTPGGLASVAQHMTRTIRKSFEQDQMRGIIRPPTDSEVKRRARIYMKWFRILRGDMGYSTERAMDFLPLALRKELDGESWEPPKTTTGWAPSVIQPKE